MNVEPLINTVRYGDHVTNTNDMDFACDEHGKISSVMLPTHSHVFVWEVKVQYVIVIARVPGIYGSKRSESEGEARRLGLFMLP